jgi:superfamily I DNA and/or RNA helicase
VRDVRLYKFGGGEDTFSGGSAGTVEHFDLYGQSGQLEGVMTSPWVIIGATPGGIYNAQRYRSTGGKDVPWDERPFDLAVVDEASQVNVPEALLACAFVAQHGQALIVGDHRQMPPIVAVEWNEESRRSVWDTEVYRSIFEFLRERRFPRLGLDRSFRLHHQLAAFLEEIIYRQDGIPFYSTRADTLDRVSCGDPFVDAVLDPQYPVVVVEHGDSTSHQFNLVELDLMTPVLDACTTRLGLGTATGVGVVVPHRAQRAMLRARFPALATAIDTVERFQGGERDVIVVSATASDPDYILGEAGFLLNPNRLNVALSRPKRKLVVLASSTLLRLLTSDPDLFEHAALWKKLRYVFASTPLWSGTLAGTAVQVFGSGRTTNDE